MGNKCCTEIKDRKGAKDNKQKAIEGKGKIQKIGK